MANFFITILPVNVLWLILRHAVCVPQKFNYLGDHFALGVPTV